MSDTIRRVPYRWLRRPRGYKAALIRGDRPGAVPTSARDDVAFNNDVTQAWDIARRFARRGLDASTIARRLRNKFRLSFAHAIEIADREIENTNRYWQYRFDYPGHRQRERYRRELRRIIRIKLAVTHWAGSLQAAIAKAYITNTPLSFGGMNPLAAYWYDSEYAKDRKLDELGKMAQHANLTPEETDEFRRYRGTQFLFEPV